MIDSCSTHPYLDCALVVINPIGVGAGPKINRDQSPIPQPVSGVIIITGALLGPEFPPIKAQPDRAATTRPDTRRGVTWMKTFLTPAAHGTTPLPVHMRTS